MKLDICKSPQLTNTGVGCIWPTLTIDMVHTKYAYIMAHYAKDYKA